MEVITSYCVHWLQQIVFGSLSIRATGGMMYPHYQQPVLLCLCFVCVYNVQQYIRELCQFNCTFKLGVVEIKKH